MYNNPKSVYREGCWTTFWLCSSSFLTVENLLQVVYEHWAKPRDIEEKEILKSSIGPPLPTCLHCVICKSNNLFMSSSLFFGVCLKMNAFRMSGSWGQLLQVEEFFFSFFIFKIHCLRENLDRLDKCASTERLLFLCVVTTVYILFVLHLPAASVSLVKSCIYFNLH